MSIKFYCQCGKRLKARESSAGRRTVCPRCAAPVGIPDRQPTHRGATELSKMLARATPQRGAGVARTRPVSEDAASPNARDPAVVVPEARVAVRPAVVNFSSAAQSARGAPAKSTRQTTRRIAGNGQISLRRVPAWWKLVTASRQPRKTGGGRRLSLAFPAISFGTAPVLCGLSLVLTIAACVALRMLPEAMLDAGQLSGEYVVFVAAVALTLTAAGYVASVLNRVLAGSAGMLPHGELLRFGLDQPLVGLATWLGCFLAGPALLAAAGATYWLRCGIPSLLDWVIIFELTMPAIAWWLLLLLAVATCRRRADLAPRRILGLARKTGFKLLVLASLAWVLALVELVLASTATSLIHRDEFAGWLLLLACVGSSVGAGGWLLRHLGGTCRQRRVSHLRREDATTAPAAESAQHALTA